ncbi:MAG: MBL fold metallo-hydrolase, partial [Bacteroidota bacterium]
MDKSKATSLIIKDFRKVRIHTFIAPFRFAANATHIIETENELVLIDAQFVNPMALAFRAYVDRLGKPINRMILSHGHPDHYFGITAAFSDVEVHALPGIDKIIEKMGPVIIKNQKSTFGDLIPDEVVLPKPTIEANTSEVIDGLTYHYEAVEDTEAELQLVIKLPELGTIVAQDLVYSDVHIWLGMGFFENWIAALKELVNAEGYDYYLAGHGLPCSKTEVQANIDYIQKALELI